MAIKGKRKIFFLFLTIAAVVLLALFFIDKYRFNKRKILPPEDSFISSSIKFVGKRHPIRVLDTAEFTPQVDRDFVLTLWVKFNRAPEPRNDYVLVQKLVGEERRRTGFEFRLNRDRSGTRPIVSWHGAPASSESEFQFSDFKFQPKTWNLFAIGIKEQRFLVMRGVSIRDDKSLDVQNLGAHDLGSSTDIKNLADLYVGALGAGNFQGELGPLMIFSGQKLIDNFDQLVAGIVQSPNTIPPLADNQQLDLRLIPSIQKVVDNTIKAEVSLESAQ